MGASNVNLGLFHYFMSLFLESTDEIYSGFTQTDDAWCYPFLLNESHKDRSFSIGRYQTALRSVKI